MKIGYVLSNLLLGGVQMVFADLAVEFSRKYEVKYAVLSMENADPILIKRFGSIPRVSPDELLEWSDIIHLDGIKIEEESKLFKPKWKRTIQNCGSGRNFSLIDRLFKHNLSPNITAVSKYIGNTLKVKHRVIYPGVDINRFKPLHVEKKYDLVIIGRMRPIKNHALFLEICKKGDFSFVTIGGTHRRLEGHVNEIEKMARAQAVEDRDFVPGFVPDEEVVPLINQARIAVVTSHSEGGPTCLEPMACGVPAVVRQVGGATEALDEYPDLIVPYDAPAEVYVEKIKKYIDDIELRKRVRETVVKDFSRKEGIKAYDELYQEVFRKWGAS